MCAVCDIVTHAHVSGELSGLIRSKAIVPHLGWFDLMALPDVHMKPAVPAPAESVFVGVCPMATCFQKCTI